MNVGRLNALLQMELPQVTAKPELTPTQATAGAEAVESRPFSEVLQQALDGVAADQVAADEAARKLATGEITDIAEVMIASERANLSLGMAIQVRNKVLEAYQEIMRISV